MATTFDGQPCMTYGELAHWISLLPAEQLVRPARCWVAGCEDKQPSHAVADLVTDQGGEVVLVLAEKWRVGRED